jgi:hypothetical protein
MKLNFSLPLLTNQHFGRDAQACVKAADHGKAEGTAAAEDF